MNNVRGTGDLERRFCSKIKEYYKKSDVGNYTVLIYSKVLKLLTKFLFEVRGSERVRILRVVILYIMKVCIIFNGNFFKNFVTYLNPWSG